MIREDAASAPAPFREVWNMTKGKNGGGWLVAGVQALQ
jgi:predicted lipid-binding transport protein (Tim44 family)